MIEADVVQRIFDAADIVDVVSDFITLKKRGVNYLGLCPFHNEKTPSFTVSPAKGICKCFGCGKGGNPVNFIMEHEQMTYVEALKYLARKYHIEIVESEQTEEEIKEKNERESMLIVSSFAQKYFTKTLSEDTEGIAVGAGYLKERGVRQDIQEKFQLGYCKDTWADFSDKALEAGYDEKFLLSTGLSIKGSKGLIDKFKGRVLFPIHSLSGRIIGFGGRILKKDVKAAKYLNSPESLIYHKSKILYGLYFAKKSLVKENRCFLVEGYTDVIAMHQAGIENVVASSGTALSVAQILLVKRFTPNITVLFDGDQAGIKASIRSIDMLLEQGMNVKVLLLPEGEDPDSFSKKQSTSEFRAYIDEHETDFITFKTQLLIDEAQGDPVKRAGLVRDIVRSISVIPDAIIRAEYIKACSRLMQIQEQVIYQQISTLLAERKSKHYVRQQQAEQLSSSDEDKPKTENSSAIHPPGIERELLRILVNYGDEILFAEDNLTVGNYIVTEIEQDELSFVHPVYAHFFETYTSAMSQEDFSSTSFLKNHPSPDIALLASDLLSEPYALSQIWTKHENHIETESTSLKEVVPKLVNQFKYRHIILLLKEVKRKMKELPKDDDDALMFELIKQKQHLDRIKSEIAKIIGERIIVK